MVFKQLFRIASIAILMMSFALQANAITLAFPLDGQECVSEDPPLEWNAEQNIQNYIVQIATDGSMNNIIYNNDTVIGSRDTADINQYGEELYWRVIAVPISGENDTSVIRSFTTRFQAPALITEDDMTCSELSMKLEWTDLSVNYHLQVATDENFVNTVVDNNLIDTNFFDITVNNYEQEFFWRVAAYFEGCKTAFSEPNSFVTKNAPVELTFPADMTVGVPLQTDGNTTVVEAVWEEVVSDPIPEYLFQLSTDETFSDSESVVELNLDTNAVELDVPQENNQTYYWRVGYTLGECFSEWSEIFSFRTEYQPVSLLNPMAQDSCVDYIQTSFCWDSLVEATAYRLQIASHPTFGDNGQDTLIYLDSAMISDTCFDFALEIAETEMYWRVRAEDDTNIGEWSEINMFRTTIAPPEGIEPKGGLGGFDLTSVIQWESVGNQDYRYHLQLTSIDTPFGDNLLDTMYLASNEFEATVPEKNAAYKWRVRVMNTDTCWSPWSMTYTYKTNIAAPELIEPADEATKVPIPIVWFEWNAVEGAENYILQLASDELFEDILAIETELVETRNIIIDFEYEANTTYFWRVLAYNTDGQSDWSEIRQFTTWIYPPELPILLAPTDDENEVALDVTLEWSGSDNTEYYEIQVFKGIFLDEIIVDDTTSLASYELTELDNYETYTWKVKAVNEAGETDWTRNFSFRTINTPPTEKAELSFPEDGTDEVEYAVRLKWQEVEHAVYYWLQLSEDESFDEIYREFKSLTTTERIVTTLQHSTEYFWRVRGWNLQGEAPWSDAYSFKTRIDVSVNEEFQKEIGLEFYPNPANDAANIEFNSAKSGIGTITLFDAQGNEIRSIFKGVISQGFNQHKVELSDLPNGVYFYTINISGKIAGGSFAKVK